MKQYLYPVIIGIAVIISVLILANAYRYRFVSTETISVTGLAEKDFTVDYLAD